MYRRIVIIGGSYLIWTLIWMFVAYGGDGHASEDAHLYLIVTGAPLAILSLALPNGSVLAIAAAGLLGTVQWIAVAAIDWYFDRRNRDPSDAR